MVNLITNDCVGAYVYQNEIRTDFMNPFIWSSINITNFCKLIKHYNEIDFNNINAKLIYNDSGICKQGSYIPKLTIDNLVEVNFFHYIQDSKYNAPTKKDGYTFFKDIIKYTTDSYKRRLEKMSGSPVFVWDITRLAWYNKENKNVLDEFKSLQSNYNIIIYGHNYLNKTDGNITMVNKINPKSEVNESAKYLYKNILKSYE